MYIYLHIFIPYYILLFLFYYIFMYYLIKTENAEFMASHIH